MQTARKVRVYSFLLQVQPFNGFSYHLGHHVIWAENTERGPVNAKYVCAGPFLNIVFWKIKRTIG